MLSCIMEVISVDDWFGILLVNISMFVCLFVVLNYYLVVNFFATTWENTGTS